MTTFLDFDRIPTARKPNDALAVPAHWQRWDADFECPVFETSVDRLRETVVKLASVDPRTNLLRLNRGASQAVFEQKSKFLGFRDRIAVVFEALDRGATLAIYSQAQSGYYDFGVNRRRIRRWLDTLRTELDPATCAAP